MKTRNEAELIGKCVARELGKGWRTRVWENQGWHVSWMNGAVTINYAEGCKLFWAMVGAADRGTGHPDLNPRDPRSFKTAREAGQWACKYAMAQIEREWRPVIESVEKLLCSFGSTDLRGF